MRLEKSLGEITTRGGIPTVKTGEREGDLLTIGGEERTVNDSVM